LQANLKFIYSYDYITNISDTEFLKSDFKCKKVIALKTKQTA